MRIFVIRFIGIVLCFSMVLCLFIFLLPYSNNHFILRQFTKMEAVSNPERGRAVILLGGSNVTFGFDSQRLEEKVGIPVINAALGAGLGLKMILDDCLPRIKSGDILVLSPEYEHFFGSTAYGGADMTYLFYLRSCQYPGSISLEQIKIILENTPSFVNYKWECLYRRIRNKTNSEGPYFYTSYNERGDVCWHWTHDTLTTYKAHQDIIHGEFNSKYFHYMIKQLKALENEDVKVLLIPPAFAYSAYRKNQRIIKEISDSLDANGYAFIIPPVECAYNDSLFYNTMYHLNYKGVIKRTENLAQNLKKYI